MCGDRAVELSAERCSECHPGAPVITDIEQRTFMAQLPDWDILDVNYVRKLRRVYRLRNWDRSMAFATEIARIADEQDHHPTLMIEFGKVTVTWFTLVVKDLHRNDFIMAAKSDKVFADFS